MVHNNKWASICALAAAALLSVFAVFVASADRADALTSDAVTITSAIVDPKSGVVRLEGTVRCSEDEQEGGRVGIDPIVVSQLQGNRVVKAVDETGVLCTDQPSSFVVQMVAFDNETGERLRLHPGRATVSGVASSPAGSQFFGPIAVRLEPSRFS